MHGDENRTKKNKHTARESIKHKHRGTLSSITNTGSLSLISLKDIFISKTGKSFVVGHRNCKYRYCKVLRSATSESFKIPTYRDHSAPGLPSKLSMSKSEGTS